MPQKYKVLVTTMMIGGKFMVERILASIVFLKCMHLIDLQEHLFMRLYIQYLEAKYCLTKF